MSRGGGRGRGGGGGRGGFGGSSSLPPMGLSFADLQNLSREATAMYPVCRNQFHHSKRRSLTHNVQAMHVPVMTEFTEEEIRMADYQLGFATRLRKSPYYIVQTTKSTGMCGWFCLRWAASS